jgi:hypothetical protein
VTLVDQAKQVGFLKKIPKKAMQVGLADMQV